MKEGMDTGECIKRTYGLLIEFKQLMAMHKQMPEKIQKRVERKVPGVKFWRDII